MQKNHLTWTPEIGEETTKLFEKVSFNDEDSKESVKKSALSILGRGIDPNNLALYNQPIAGLVTGYIQSGKTFSFTSVMALAHDNGFKLIILIAGTSNALFNQSTDRLRSDLIKDDKSSNWKLLKNPRKNDSNTKRALRGMTNNASKTNTTIILSIMKNYNHLKNLNELLDTLDLNNISALIIDDEADRASLNINAKGTKNEKPSQTYTQLNTLRSKCPNHTFLQYTATPQALLLLGIEDFLSPEFVEVLNPGQDYIGGKVFFDNKENKKKYICKLPDIEISEPPKDDPPETLMDALRVFVLCVAVKLKSQNGKESPNLTSMLIHPSHKTAGHGKYRKWSDDILDRWISEFNSADSGQNDIDDYEETLIDFEKTYEEILENDNGLPAFNEIKESIIFALGEIQTETMNSKRDGATSTPNWKDSKAWVIVGGEAINRGVTIEGLTVTYMPRKIGAGHIDSIQQWARFFGYRKKSDLKFFRLYLGSELLDTFIDYVEHEEYLRDSLKKIQLENQTLYDWKRMFILSSKNSKLKLTRESVLKDKPKNLRLGNNVWLPLNHLGLDYLKSIENITANNREVFTSFIDELDFTILKGLEENPPVRQHFDAEISLEELISNLLSRLKMNPWVYSEHFRYLLLYLSYLRDKDRALKVRVYNMRPNCEDSTRSILSDGSIRIFQGPGRNSNSSNRYPGDRSFHDEKLISIQLHKFIIKNQDDEIVATDIPFFGIHLPFDVQLIIQD